MTKTPFRPARPGRRALLALAALTPLAACTPARILGSDAPPRLFNLTPADEFAPGLPQVDWQLLVETPLASTGIDTPRIALETDSNQLTYYANANWVDTAPEMIQLLLIESFENTNRIVAVGREATGLRSDYVLKTDLRDFQAEYSGGEPGEVAPEAHVRIAAKLVRMPRRNIVAADEFEARVQAASPRLADVVAAFDAAVHTVMRRAVEWTLRQGEATAAQPAQARS